MSLEGSTQSNRARKGTQPGQLAASDRGRFQSILDGPDEPELLDHRIRRPPGRWLGDLPGQSHRRSVGVVADFDPGEIRLPIEPFPDERGAGLGGEAEGGPDPHEWVGADLVGVRDLDRRERRGGFGPEVAPHPIETALGIGRPLLDIAEGVEEADRVGLESRGSGRGPTRGRGIHRQGGLGTEQVGPLGIGRLVAPPEAGGPSGQGGAVPFLGGR